MQSVCPNLCYTYSLSPMGMSGMDPGWQVVDEGGNPISFTLIDGGAEIRVCFPDFGSYTISTGDGNNAFFVFAGEVTEVELELVEPLGCVDQQVFDCFEVCVGAEVTFAIKDIRPSETQWSISGGAQIIEESAHQITILFDETPGTIFISFFGTIEQGCIFESSACINVFERPVASFSSFPQAENDTILICRGQNIELNNTSDAPFVTWTGGTQGSGEGSTYRTTFNDEGQYRITQRVSSGCECSDEKVITVIVLPAIAPAIYCLSSVCQGDTSVYSADIDCGPYNWQIEGNGTVIEGGGSDDDFISVIWNGGQEGIVQMNNACSSDCPLPAREVVYILGDETSITGPVNICPGVAYQYQIDAYDGALIEWGTSDFGTIVNGQNTPQITIYFPFFLAEPYITVQVENCTRGCTETDTLFLTPSAPFNIIGPASVCPGEEITFNALSGPSPVSATWQITDRFGNILVDQMSPSTSFDFMPMEAGTYFITGTVVGPNYCNRNDEAVIIVQGELPTIISVGGPTNICPGNYYDYEVILSGGGAVSIEWIVDNGNEVLSYFGTNVRIAWTDAAEQNLIVKVVDLQSGCQTQSERLAVTPITGISWEVPDVVCNFMETLIEIDVPDSDQISWSISPQEQGVILEYPTNNSARIKWQQPGTATVEASYCGFTLTQVVQINGDFVPEMFAPDFLCGSEEAVTSTTETYDRYEWYSDGTLACTTPTCVMQGRQNMVIVYDDLGCRGVERFEIELIEDPEVRIATLGSVAVCDGDSLTIYLNRVLNPDFTYNWYHNGNLVGTDTDTLVAYDPGEYSIEAIHNSSGCVFASNILTICERCDSDETLFVCPGGSGSPGFFPMSCDNTLGDLNPIATQGANCTDYSFEVGNPDVLDNTIRWLIIDGPLQITLNDPNPTYSFQNGGRHLIYGIGKIIGPMGDTLELCPRALVITIGSMPDFSFDILCADDSVSFNQRIELIPGITVSNIEWNFGDPMNGSDNISTDLDPQHLFSSAGTYDVTLKIEDSEACIVEKTKTIVVPPAPDPEFGITSPICTDEYLSANSLMPEGLYTWNFDQQNYPDRIDDRFNPGEYRYLVPGDYDIRLEVENFRGCKSEQVKTVSVLGFDEELEIMTDKDFPLCEGEEVLLSVISNPDYTYLWSNGGSAASTAVTLSGSYSVTVTDNISGCSIEASIEATYFPAPTVEINAQAIDGTATFVADTMYVCNGTGVLLQALGPEGNRTFVWNNNATQQTLRYDGEALPLLTPDLYTFSVEVTNMLTGCSANSEVKYIRVLPSPGKPQISSDPTGPLCSGSPIILNITNVDPSAQYLWSNGDPGIQTRVETAGSYGVLITNEFGCTAYSETLEVHPLPNVNSAPRGCYEACDEVTICIPIPDGYSFLAWERDGEGISIPPNPREVLITETGSYEAVIANQYGCEARTAPINIDIFGDSTEVSGMVFYDEDNDGNFLPPDSLLSGMTIYLWQNGMLLDSTITDGNGDYVFGDLPSGDYILIIDKGTITENWIAINDSITITLESCEPDQTSDPFIFIECVTETTTTTIVSCEGSVVEVAGLMLTRDTIITITEVIDFCEFEDRYEVSFEPKPDSTFLFSYNCKGEAVDFQGLKIDSDTIIYETLPALYDCDSIVVHRFVFSTEVLRTSEMMICRGDTMMIGEELIFKDTLIEVRRIGVNGACDTLEQINIMLNPNIEAELMAEASCPNEDLGVIVIDIDNVHWPNIQSFFIDDLIYEPRERIEGFSPGQHELIINDIFGCSEKYEVEIDSLEPLVVDIEDRELPCDVEGVELTIEVLSGMDDLFKIAWFDGSSDTSIWVRQAGNYIATVSNSCEEVEVFATVRSEFGDGEVQYYVPNTFTPNEDKVNDTFLPYFKKGTKFVAYHFEIFDRWGNRMFVTTDPMEGWDGIFLGRLADQAVFVWKLVGIVEYCGTTEEIKDYGDVLLMKL